MNFGEHLQEFHPDIYKRLTADSQAASILAMEMPPSGNNFDRGMMMARLVHNRAPGYLELVPAVAEFFCDVLTEALELRAVPDSALPRRPPEAGLPQALGVMIQARMRFGSTKLASLTLDPGATRAELARICALRNCAAPTAAVLRAVMRNLAVTEDHAYTEMKNNYEMVRSMAKADPTLAFMQFVDQYLFGSAEKAAETRRDNRRSFEDMTVKAQKEGQAAANRKARADLSEEFAGLMQDLRLTNPNPDPTEGDGRNTPR